MALLKALLEKLDDVDEKYRDLYTERNGKFEFAGVEGMKTQADIDRIMEGLRKEKNDHNELKKKYHSLSGMEVDDIIAKLDKYPELEAAATGKIDDAKLEQMVASRIGVQLNPVKRELDKTVKERNDLQTLVDAFKQEKTSRLISDAVREAAKKAQMLDTAVEDAILYAERMFEVAEDGSVITKDGVGVVPGINAEMWLQDIQSKRPHWWAPSLGAGAMGSKGPGGVVKNPWTHENWNMTEQMQIFRADRNKAEKMAEMAGTKVGGARPAPKK